MMPSKASQEGSWIESFPSPSEPTTVVAGNGSVLVRSKMDGDPVSCKVRDSPIGLEIFLEEAAEEFAEDAAPPLPEFDFELDFFLDLLFLEFPALFVILRRCQSLWRELALNHSCIEVLG